MKTHPRQHTRDWAASLTGARRWRRRLGTRLTQRERRFLLALLDLAVVNGALVAALALLTDFPVSLPTLAANVKWFVTLSAVWFAVGMVMDVYDPARAASTIHSTTGTAAAGLVTTLAYVAIPWLTPRPGRRTFVVVFGALAVGGLAAWRAAYALLLVQPGFRRRVLVVGQGAAARRLAAQLDAAAHGGEANPFKGTGYQVVGMVEELPEDGCGSLDPAQELLREIDRQDVDEILVTRRLAPSLREAVLDCRELGMPVLSFFEAYARLTYRLPVEVASSDPGFLTMTTDGLAERLFWSVKRVADVAFALLGLALTGVLAPLIALGNALTGSPGPLLYRQQRVGRGGRPFRVVKFRTMQPDAERDRALWAADQDPRVTPLGHWLRVTRLDELPQCVNILRGEMSLIGPRPERPCFVGQISRQIPIYRARHAVPPGITGWAQVRYRYGNSLEDARRKLEYDLYYVKNAGFWLDMVILLQTIRVVLTFRGQ